MLPWARSVPHPWCTVDQVEQSMPQIEPLYRVAHELRASV